MHVSHPTFRLRAAYFQHVSVIAKKGFSDGSHYTSPIDAAQQRQPAAPVVDFVGVGGLAVGIALGGIFWEGGHYGERA
jgi:hypothetical protein